MPIKQISAEKEYEKNPDIKKEDITKLQEWARCQPHLPEIPELQLIFFYHSCENGVALTKTTIDLYYTQRTHLESFFVDRSPKSEKNTLALERILYAPLPQTTKEGYKIIYARLFDYEVSNFNYEAAARNFVMVTDLYQLEEGTFPGFIILIDLDRVTLGHVTRLPIMAIKHTLDYLQSAMPVRLKGFHFLNTPSFMDKILALMRPFMNKSFQENLHLHPAPIDSVYKFVAKEALPKELGGKYDDFLTIRDNLIKKMQDNCQYFDDELKMRVDESKRLAKSKAAEAYGVEGSFKKLSID